MPFIKGMVLLNFKNLIILLERISSTIDRKVQNIISVLNKEIKSIKGIKAVPRSPYARHTDLPSLSDYTLISTKDKKIIIQKIEDSSNVISRLLTLKSKLSTTNSDLVYSLLNQNYYLEFSSRELCMIIEGKGALQRA